MPEEVKSAELVVPETMDKKQLAMERAGATRDRAYKTMVEALDATTITVDKYGEEHIHPDTASRLRASELITKAHGDWKDGVTINNNTLNANITVTKEEVRQLVDMVSSVNAELVSLKTSGRQTGRIYKDGKVYVEPDLVYDQS